MKRAGSIELPFPSKRRNSEVDLQAKAAPARPQRPPRGLSSGLQRSGSLGGGAASSAGGSGKGAGAPGDLPEVSSPPPTRPMGFVSELPASPFALAAALTGSAAPPWQHGADRRQQHGGAGASASASESESESEESLQDQENQQPGSSGCGAAAPPTWLVSPVRPRARPAPAPGAASAPLPIPSPLLSPLMPTPRAAAAERASSATLHHAPSFSSWMVPATRAPSPPPSGRPAAARVDVGDVVGNLAGDCRAPRPFERGAPSHLDRLLAELGDSHYPSSILQWEQEELGDSDTN